jgi:hypothetical protein
MKFIPTTQRNGACEICDDVSGKCRRLSDADIHLCMTFADARVGELQNGFKCVKPDKGKGWATFKLDNSQEWSDEQRREWQAKAQARRQQQTLAAVARKKRSLAAIERDRLYRQLLAELELHPEDCADLKRRGLSNLQIELIGFKSIGRNYPQLCGRYPDLLPGIDDGGHRLISLGVGYLCPIRNKNGLVVACQLRLRVLPSGQENRYRWLSGGEEKGQVLHFFPQNGNPEGELPLAICRPEEQSQFVAITEGTGVKPNYTALNYGLFTIGAAGGNFLSSEATFREALELGTAESRGDRCIRLFPDGGDIQNRHVAARWEQLILTLQEWGYPVLVGWWDQRTKTDPDIDELTPGQFAQIRYLEPKDFLAILAEQFPQKGFGSNARVVATPHTGQAWDLWRNSRLFEPDYQSNAEFFDAPIPGSGTATYVRSGTGTGKTHWLRQVIRDLVDQGFLSIGYRNSLLIQFSEDANLAGTWNHLQQDLKGSPTDLLLIRDPHSKILSCIDSLTYFEPKDFDGKIVILDEVESIVEQLLKANTAVSYQREKIKHLFTEMLKRCDRVIFLDGHLRNSTVEYLQTLMGHCKKPVRYLNTYAGNKGQVELLEGVETVKGIRVNDRSPVIQALSSNTERFVVGADSQEEIEALDRVFKAQGRKTLRFDSTTSRSPWAKQFLKDPPEYLRANNIEILLYSPSAEAGLNIDIKGYFSDAYFLFFGVITTNAQLQLMARVRDPQMKTHIWCSLLGFPSQAVSKSALPEKLSEEIKQYVLDCATASLSGLSVEEMALNLAQQLVAFSADRHFEHEMLLTALENHERANLRDCLREGLQHSGYKVESVFGQKFSLTEIGEKRQEIRQEKSVRTYSAENITTEESNQKSRNFSATEEERYQVSRRRLLDRLPGIEDATYRVSVSQIEIAAVPSAPISEAEPLTNPSLSNQQSPQATDTPQVIEKPVFDPEFIRRVKWQDRKLISQIELRWLIEHPEAAKQLQQIRWHKRLSLFTDPDEPDCNKRLNLSDYHSRWLKIYRLQEMGVDFFLQPGAVWHSESSEAIAFWNTGKHPRHAKAIGRRVGKSSVCTYIGEILESIGLKTQWAWGQDEAGNKIRIYSLSQEALTDPILNAIYEAVGRRFETALSGDRVGLDWEAVTQAFEEVQSQVAYRIEAGSVSTILVLKSQEGDLNQSEAETPTLLTQVEPDQSITSEPILKLVEAVECCRSFNEFVSTGQRLFRGKPESFLGQIFRLLSPESLQRVIGWSKQIPNSA